MLIFNSILSFKQYLCIQLLLILTFYFVANIVIYAHRDRADIFKYKIITMPIIMNNVNVHI